MSGVAAAVPCRIRTSRAMGKRASRASARNVHGASAIAWRTAACRFIVNQYDSRATSAQDGPRQIRTALPNLPPLRRQVAPPDRSLAREPPPELGGAVPGLRRGPADRQLLQRLPMQSLVQLGGHPAQYRRARLAVLLVAGGLFAPVDDKLDRCHAAVLPPRSWRSAPTISGGRRSAKAAAIGRSVTRPPAGGPAGGSRGALPAGPPPCGSSRRESVATGSDCPSAGPLRSARSREGTGAGRAPGRL